MQYLMIDGHGGPNSSQEFTDAVQALYPVAYKLKFASKQDLGRDYVVTPFTTARDKSRWDWTLMLMVPDWITRETLRRMHEEFIPGSGLTMTGKHHEIYLSDFRKTDPGKLRTVLRQPVTSAHR